MLTNCVFLAFCNNKSICLICTTFLSCKIVWLKNIILKGWHFLRDVISVFWNRFILNFIDLKEPKSYSIVCMIDGFAIFALIISHSGMAAVTKLVALQLLTSENCHSSSNFKYGCTTCTQKSELTWFMFCPGQGHQCAIGGSRGCYLLGWCRLSGALKICAEEQLSMLIIWFILVETGDASIL